MRQLLVFGLLNTLKWCSRAFYSFDRWEWVGRVPQEPAWTSYRLVAILNHTSLYEVLFAGGVPARFLRRMSRHGVVPVAAKTTRRPIIGTFFKMVAGNVVSISRERDETWDKVMRSVGSEAMVIILPEGRMKRADGLDSFGKPLVIRSGIVELMEAIGEGKMLLAYSLGLHHIQVPGQTFPRLFQPVTLRLEELDLGHYRQQILASAGEAGYRRAVIEDLTHRRDHYCDPEIGAGPLPETAPLQGTPPG